MVNAPGQAFRARSSSRYCHDPHLHTTRLSEATWHAFTARTSVLDSASPVIMPFPAPAFVPTPLLPPCHYSHRLSPAASLPSARRGPDHSSFNTLGPPGMTRVTRIDPSHLRRLLTAQLPKHSCCPTPLPAPSNHRANARDPRGCHYNTPLSPRSHHHLAPGHRTHYWPPRYCHCHRPSENNQSWIYR